MLLPFARGAETLFRAAELMGFIDEFAAALLAGAILYAPFTWLLWASGYLRILLKAARLNRWGFGFE